MGTWFEKRVPCGRWQDWLDAATEDGAPARNLQEWMAGILPEDREHFLACEECRVATEAWLGFRESLRAMPEAKGSTDPWFAARVMAAIAESEEEARPWIAVPHFASRVAWAAAALLAVASTWLYERPLVRPSQPPVVSSPEGIFDTQSPPVTEDEVLISLAEKNHE